MDEAGRKKLWEEYDKTRSSAVREKIILEYAPLVKMVAGRLSMYLGYNVEYEDLVSYGIFGLRTLNLRHMPVYASGVQF